MDINASACAAMQLLTPSGYVDVSTLRVGDSVCAFDENTGAPIVNTIERLERWQIVDGALKSFDLATGEEIGPQFSEWKFYRINGTWTVFCEQSIWRNGTNVCHAKHLVIGDEIYDDTDAPVAITSIEEVTSDIWYRFDISGDHSYIADGVTLHNASRFCKPGAGTADWTAINTGIWAATTTGATGQTVPGSADTVTCDANFGGGTCRVNFGGAITVQSITCGAMVGTLDFSVFNNDITLSAATGMNNSGSATRTLKLGNGQWTLTGAGLLWTFGTITGLTFDAGSSEIIASATTASTRTLTLGNSLSYNKITVTGNTGGGDFKPTNSTSNTIATLSVSGPNVIEFPNGATTTITNGLNVTASSSAVVGLMSNDLILSATISSANAGASSWVAVRNLTLTGGGAFTATSSFDLGHNSGITITPPSAGSAGMLYIPNLDGV